MELRHAERLDAVAAHLESLPDKRFNIRFVYSRDNYPTYSRESLGDCGTAACILGWSAVVARERTDLADPEEAMGPQDWLGLGYENGDALFMPPGYNLSYASVHYTRRRAVAVLRDMAEQVRADQDARAWPRWDKFDSEGRLRAET